MGRLRLFVAWILATAVALGMAFGAVSIVAGDITEQPRELAASTPSVVPTVSEASSTTSTMPDSEPVVSPDSEPEASTTSTTEDGASPSTTEAAISPSTTEQDSVPSTTEDDASPSTTEAAISPSTTEPSPSTTVPASVLAETVSLAGNWARFTCAGEVAGLEAFGVGPGYRLSEPPELSGSEAKVEFESSDGTVEVELGVKCEDGSIETWSEADES